MQALYERDPDLSIIIPVYNLERFLGPMLHSLKSQDFGDYAVEIIFVLNNCTDASEQVIRDSGLPCRLITCPRQGCGPARNAGMDAATGEYIWFMDGDDWLLSPRAVFSVLDRAKREHLNILLIPFASARFNAVYYSMVWQYLLRREFIKGIRFPAIQPAEDDAFMAEVLSRTGLNRSTFIFLPTMPEQLYYYNYLREGSNMWRHYRGERL